MLSKILFIFGLTLFLVGQILLSNGNDYVYAQKPIDFAHWCLLIGAVCLIPQVINYTMSKFSIIGIPLTLIGIACLIGMCVIDFIFWSYPTDQARNEFAEHIMNVPSIWLPFMKIGSSSKIFNTGLLLLSLNSFGRNNLGVLIILVANLVLWHFIPLSPRLVIGYCLTLLGFTILLFDINFIPLKNKSANNQKMRI